MPILNEEQIKLAAQYFAASNTGLIGCGYNPPTDKQKIKSVYSQISGAYQEETGEGLWEEQEMWKKSMGEISDIENTWYKKIQQEIPFILEA